MEKEKRRKYYGMNKTTTKKKSEERINDKRFTWIEEDSIQVEVFYYHLYYNDIGEHAAKTKGVLQYLQVTTRKHEPERVEEKDCSRKGKSVANIWIKDQNDASHKHRETLIREKGRANMISE